MNEPAKTTSIAKNSIYYTTSTLICMVIPFIYYPYILRTLGPEFYGKISFQQTLVSYFVILATLGINNYAQKVCSVNGSDKNKLSKAVYEILLIAGTLTIVSCVAYIVTVLFIDIDKSDYPIYFIGLGMILFSSLKMDWLLVAKERFFFTATRDVTSKTLLLILVFLLIKTQDEYIVFALLLTVTYAMLPALFNYVYVIKERLIGSLHGGYLTVSNHLQPILFLSLVTIGSKIFSSADIVMIRFFKGETAVGIYNNAIKLPLVLDELLMAIAAVVTPRMYSAVKNNDEKEIHYLVNYASNTMFFFAVPAIITCMFYSEELVVLLGGSKFAEGSNILVIYSLIMLTTLCLTLAGTRMFIAKGMEKQLFIFLMIAGAVNIGLNAFLIPLLGTIGAAVASVTSNFALLVAELIYAKTAKYLLDLDKLKYLISGTVLVLVFLIVRFVNSQPSIIRLFLSIFIGGIFYVISLYIQKETTLTRIISTIKSKVLK